MRSDLLQIYSVLNQRIFPFHHRAAPSQEVESKEDLNKA
jgi:hypothetical protein